MAVSRISLGIFAIIAVICTIIVPMAQAQSTTSPAPAPTSDGTAIDQGIACILMFVALALTYLMH